MQKRVLCYAVASLLSFSVYGQYTYEAGQDLYHLQTNANNFEGELAYEVVDDGISPAIDLSFNFTFYGSTFTQARMATNGCLHFGNNGSYCNDYTPDPINGQHTYTIYPFWTDLIRDNNSRMKSWGDSGKMIFGWYDMREYNRSNTDNSFEIILWNNNSFDIRYGALEIINHDVLIGEVGSKKEDSYTYYYHDECSTGTTNSSACVNTNWNTTTINTTLENGGSLYGSGSGNGVDCSDPLNDSSCSGYADALLTQQCNITGLYSESCPNYWQAYDDQQCDEDPQYAPFCQGYRQEDSVAFFDDEQVDYGFIDEQDQFATGIFTEDHHDNQGFEEQFTITEIFEDDMFPPFEEFNGDNFEEFFGGPEPEELIIFFDSQPLPFIDEFNLHHDDNFHHQDDILIEEFIFQETFLVEDYAEPNTFIELETIEELEERLEEETNEHFEERHEEEFVDLDDPEEEFIEEIFEEEAVEEIFEAIEERIAEAEIEEERLEREEVVEEFEEVFEEEFQTAEREEATGKSSISRDIALKVVASTITVANQSVSGTNSGNSIHATGNTLAAGNAVSNSSNSGISTSSSPSMSDQFASSTAQTNQVLNMSSMSVSGSSFSSTSVETETVSTDAVVSVGTVETTQDQMDTSIASVSADTDSETTVENIIAQNLQTAQEQVAAKQEETGEYGSENAIIAVMGFLPGFNAYRAVDMPQKELWYEPKSIYTNNTISDNTAAFYGLAGQSIKTLTDLRKLQPAL